MNLFKFTRTGLVIGVAALLLVAPSVQAGEALRPHEQPEDEYGESYTFIADLDDGTYVQVQLGVTNIGPGSRHGLCRALVKRPGRKAWTGNERVGSDRWKWAIFDQDERLRVGPCIVKASPNATVVYAHLDEATVEIAYSQPLSPQPFPPAPLIVGQRQFQAWVMNAFLPVKATLTLPGASKVVLQGGGYADHSRTTVASKEMFKTWLRFRALRGPQQLILTARQTEQGQTMPAWCLREGGQPIAINRSTAERTGGTKAEPTWKVLIEGQGIAGTIYSQSFLYRHAPVEEIGGILAGIVSPVVGSPVTFTHRAVLKLSDGSEVEGILEVEFSNE